MPPLDSTGLRVPQIREAWRTIVTADLAGAALRLVRPVPHMSDAMRRYAVAFTWSQMVNPSRELDLDVWVDLWRAAGYSINGDAAARPTSAIVVHRGCTPGGEVALSWTTNRDIAIGFTWMAPDLRTGKRRYRGPGSADPLAETPNGRVVTALAPAAAVLGEFRGDAGRSYRFDNRAARRSSDNRARAVVLEMVVDPRMIRIIESGSESA